MWRISPMAADAAPDRVNLWPLAYHNGHETSVLWPIFDIDDRGFAVRPLVAKEGTAWSVLWPLSSFDTARGTGWAFPWYRFENNTGVFPVANFGRWNFVGPAWWKKDGGKTTAGGLFPIAAFGNLNYVGPVWWLSGGGEYGDIGLFPVAMFGELNYVGPVWWGRGGDSHGVFPLYGKNLFGSPVRHVGPAWWKAEGDDGFAGGLFPLLSFSSDGSRFMLLPLYSHTLRPGSRTRNALLGLGHTFRGETKEEDWLLPLYYRRVEGDKKDTALFPFFWKRTRGDLAQVYTLLGHRRVAAEDSSLSIYPLWWSSRSADSSWRMLLPFFYYGEEGDERTLITPLGGRGWSRTGESAFVNFLGPLYHRSVSKRRDESRTALLWPLFERHRKGESTTTRMVPFFSSTSSPDEGEAWYALGLGARTRDATGSSHRLWPLYSWSTQDKKPSILYDLTLVGHPRRGERTDTNLFPLYASTKTPERSEVDGLLGLLHYGKRGAGPAQATEAWLWPLASYHEGVEAGGFLRHTTLFGRARWEEGRSFQVGCSLLYSNRRGTRGDTNYARRSVLSLFSREREDRTGPFVPSGPRLHPANRVSRRANGLLFGIISGERETYRVWKDGTVAEQEAHALATFSVRQETGEDQDQHADAAREVLARHGAALSADEGPEALRDAIDDFTLAQTEIVEHRQVRVPLLYGYERTGEEVSWYGPLWLVRSRREPDHAKFSVLYYAYRSETKGEWTTRDLFPFITWDTGPGETRFSFLWRLVHYERHGNRRGGHVLFIPWGDH